MTLDLLSATKRFSHLDIFVESKFRISNEELQQKYGFLPKRAAFFDIPWHEEMVYLMREEEFSQSESLKAKYPGLFLLTFKPVPEELKSLVFELKEEATSVYNILDFISSVVRERSKLKLVEEGQKRCSSLFKEAYQYLSDKGKGNDDRFNEIFKLFLTFDSKHFQLENLNRFIEEASQVFSGLCLWEGFGLTDLDEILTKREHDPSYQLFPLDWLGLPHFISYKQTCNDRKESSFVLSLILEWLEKFAAFHPELTNAEEQHSLWEETMSQLPQALALINYRGDLIVYNQKFTAMNLLPRDCLNLKDGEALEIKGQFYKVKRVELERESEVSYLFLFANEEQLQGEEEGRHKMKSISSQELGIISSSIAHELNNPLAGILAAIGYLELEDWSDEGIDALNDMKASAKRCKTLVEIFLGFSRAKDHQQKTGTMREALGQALDLLRFRMVESGVRVEVDAEVGGEPFKRYINLSLASMILYLVLGEILTLFNHHRLVLGNNELKTLKANYKEENEKITLTFLDAFELEDKILDSKLVQYLLEVQGLEMEIDNKKIILTDWKLI